MLHTYILNNAINNSYRATNESFIAVVSNEVAAATRCLFTFLLLTEGRQFVIII